MNRLTPRESHPSSSTSSQPDQDQRSPLMDVSNTPEDILRRSPRLAAPPVQHNPRKRSIDHVEGKQKIRSPQKRRRKMRAAVPLSQANPLKRKNNDPEEEPRPQKRGRGENNGSREDQGIERGTPDDWAR